MHRVAIAQTGFCARSVASQYSCTDAASEHFNASPAGLRGATREGYMSVLVYGHSEHVV